LDKGEYPKLTIDKKSYFALYELCKIYFNRDRQAMIDSMYRGDMKVKIDLIKKWNEYQKKVDDDFFGISTEEEKKQYDIDRQAVLAIKDTIDMLWDYSDTGVTITAVQR
jgi:hypothetical protein